jgi:hypothetical protein
MLATSTVAAAALFAETMAKGSSDQPDHGESADVKRLVAWLYARGHGDPEMNAAMTMVEAAPSDRSRIVLLARVLASRSAHDPAVARELTALIEAIYPPPPSDTVNYSGAGIINR